MYQQQLQQLGLNEKQAKVYEILLNFGKAGIKDILQKTPYKRGDLYNILYSLQDKGLIAEKKGNNKKIFILENPNHLNEMIEAQERQLKENKEILETILPDFKINYNTVFDKPGVKYLEGINGFKKIYQDILKTKKNLRIFSSPHDKTNTEMEKIIERNIDKQKQAGITTQVFVSNEYIKSKKQLEKLKNQGIEARIIPDQSLAVPSQIVIYGDKVALTSLKNELITTLIENKNISQAWKMIFDYIWNTSCEKTN